MNKVVYMYDIVSKEKDQCVEHIGVKTPNVLDELVLEKQELVIKTVQTDE